jgi:hypothetical protein
MAQTAAFVSILALDTHLDLRLLRLSTWVFRVSTLWQPERQCTVSL